MGNINLDKKYERILRAKINRRGRSKDTFSNSLDKILDASDLIEVTHKKVKNRRLIQEARRQFIITLVTSIEVLLKDYFLMLLTYNSIIEKFRKLPEYSDRKFSLADMEFCKEKNISESDLISENYIFQNISDINRSFSIALSTNFFEDLKNFKWWFNKKDPKEGFIMLGDFYEKLDKIINLRHDFVHDMNFKFKLSKSEVGEIEYFVILFLSQLGFYMSEKLDKLKE